MFHSIDLAIDLTVDLTIGPNRESRYRSHNRSKYYRPCCRSHYVLSISLPTSLSKALNPKPKPISLWGGSHTQISSFSSLPLPAPPEDATSPPATGE
eukprot:7601543-Pyramimonas_sp.AAC.1